MFKIKIEGLSNIQAEVDDLIKHRIPKMTAIALTETAKRLRDETRKEMQRVFDRPNPWTLGGVFYKSASANNLNAYVWFKDETATAGGDFAHWFPDSRAGIPAAKYLWPEVHGGPRNYKAFELDLIRAGVMPAGHYAMPGKGARIDKYGNISHGQLVQILTAVKALPGLSTIQGHLAPFKKGKSTKNYFVARPGEARQWKELGLSSHARGGGHLEFGVWERYGNRQVRPVLIFVKKKPYYRQRLPFYDWAQEYINTELPKIFNRIAAESLVFEKVKRGG